MVSILLFVATAFFHFFFRFMELSGGFAENKNFFDVGIQSFMQNNNIRLDSQTEEILAQKVLSCLQHVVYVISV